MSVEFAIVAESGSHARLGCPVQFNLPKDDPALRGQSIASLRLTDESGAAFPVQFTDTGDSYSLHWVIRDLPPNSHRVYLFRVNETESPVQGVEFVEEEKQVRILIAGEWFTSYVYDPALAKPYVGPVMGPDSESYTRLDFETKEHPHHRSMWFAIGDVNGWDMWNEPEGRYGRQLHQGFAELIGGSVYGKLQAANIWADFHGRPLLDEVRVLTFYSGGSDCRIVDVAITLTASYGKVELGATKEAGPLGIRVAPSMSGINGGILENSYSALGEKECWGRRAHWCDYHGDAGAYHQGVAIFDHPGNENYPTYWHVRDGGLMAPNNFYFIGGKLLAPGDTVRYRYRVCFHQGDTASAQVSERFHDYINPPVLIQRG